MKRVAIASIALIVASAACAPAGGRAPDPPDPPNGPDCAYPTDTADPMALGEPLLPYAWSAAKLPDGSVVRADLADAPCGDDPLWSAFDVLAFISIPAW